MKDTTELMHAEIGRAICELRRRMEWSQEQLANAMTKNGQYTHPVTVSRLGTRIDSPSPEKRMILTRMTHSKGHEDLADLFRAPLSAWRLASYVWRTRAALQIDPGDHAGDIDSGIVHRTSLI